MPKIASKSLSNIAITKLAPNNSFIAVGDPAELYVRKTAKSTRFYLRYKNETLSLGEFIFNPKGSSFGVTEARSKAHTILNELKAKSISITQYKNNQKINYSLKIYFEKFLKSRELKGLKSKSIRAIRNRIVNHCEKILDEDIRNFANNPATIRNFLEDFVSKDDKGFTDMKRRVINDLQSIFEEAKYERIINFNPIIGLKSRLGSIKKCKHRKAITDEELLKEFLIDLKNHNFDNNPILKFNLYFLLLTAVRPANACQAEWSEIDFEKKLWTIPANKMKISENGNHIVPLSSHLIKLLEALYPLTAHSNYLFASLDIKGNPTHLHLNAPRNNIKKIQNGKYKEHLDAHGFRTIFTTFTNKNSSKIIEKHPMDFTPTRKICIAHKVNDKTEEAYNRKPDLEAVRNLFQWYADFLNELCPFDFENGGNK